MPHERIQVYARVRPSKETLIQKVVQIDNKVLSVNLNNEIKSFQFDGIYGEDAKQDEVFDGAASRIVHGTLQGYNGTVFAYGQTGSGKTHTMIGPNNKKFDENAGIIPRGLHLLFEELNKKAEEMPGKFTSKITVSFVEIYNESIYDLFVTNNEKLKIGQDQGGKAIVRGVTEVPVNDLDDAMQEVMNGWKNRRVAETEMNRASSRSHALLMIKIHTEESREKFSTTRSAFLNLVDLAGSERVSQSKVEGDRLKETAQINLSLHNLTLVIRELWEKKKNGVVSFRNSVLTHILKDSLGGNARTAVMINVHPDKCYYSETLSTLRFSAEVRRIENEIEVNEDLKDNSVGIYQGQIRRLNEEFEKMQNMNAKEMAETKRSLEAWKDAAAKYQIELAVARRVNAAIVARKDGHAASMAESIWEKSMAEVAESVRNVPTSGIRSVQLRELTEQLNLCVFEKDELQSQLDDERKAKAELHEKYGRILDSVVSPRRSLHLPSSKQVSSMLGRSSAPLTPVTREGGGSDGRKRRRMEKREIEEEETSAPVEMEEIEVDEETSADNVSYKLIEMEMQLNTQKQIIDEKTQEAESLFRLLKDAEKRISEAEEQLSNAVQSMEEKQKRAEALKEKLKEATKMIVAEKEKVIELEKREMGLEEELAEAKDEMARLQSDTDLLKSTHKDELCELEKRLTNNLSDKVKKEVDMKSEVDRLNEEMISIKNQLLNKETEKNATEEILTMVKDRMLEAEKEKSEKMEELESLNAQTDEMKRGMEKMEEEREKSRIENEKKIGTLEKELDEKKKEIEGDKKKMEELESLMAQMDNRRRGMEVTIEKMEEEREKSRIENERKIGVLENELDEKKKEIEGDKMKMEEMGETSSSQLSRLQLEISSLRIAKDTELRSKLAEKDKDIDHWKTVAHDMSDKIDEMRAEAELLTTQEKKKRRESEEREMRAKEEAERLSRQLLAAEKRNSEAELELVNAAHSMEEERKKAEILKEKIDEAAKMIEKREATVRELEKRYAEVDGRLGEANEQLDYRATQMDEMRRGMESSMREREEEMEKSMDYQKEKIEQLEKELADMQKEMEEERREMEHVKREKGGLTREMDDMKKGMEEERRKRDAMAEASSSHLNGFEDQGDVMEEYEVAGPSKRAPSESECSLLDSSFEEVEKRKKKKSESVAVWTDGEDDDMFADLPVVVARRKRQREEEIAMMKRMQERKDRGLPIFEELRVGHQIRMASEAVEEEMKRRERMENGDFSSVPRRARTARQIWLENTDPMVTRTIKWKDVKDKLKWERMAREEKKRLKQC